MMGTSYTHNYQSWIMHPTRPHNQNSTPGIVASIYQSLVHCLSSSNLGDHDFLLSTCCNWAPLNKPWSSSLVRQRRSLIYVGKFIPWSLLWTSSPATIHLEQFSPSSLLWASVPLICLLDKLAWCTFPGTLPVFVGCGVAFLSLY